MNFSMGVNYPRFFSLHVCATQSNWNDKNDKYTACPNMSLNSYSKIEVDAQSISSALSFPDLGSSDSLVSLGKTFVVVQPYELMKTIQPIVLSFLKGHQVFHQSVGYFRKKRPGLINQVHK